MESFYIGVDPGSKGAIVTLASSGLVESSLRLGKASESDIWDYLRKAGRLGHDGHFVAAVIEQVHAMPGQGVSSSFKFGQAYGALMMALTCSGIPWRTVLPRDWQKGCGPLSKGKDDSAQRKRELKAEAQRRFPGENIVLENADAYLIADFARRTNWG